MKKIIPYGKQNITEKDIEAVTIALQSDYLTQGPYIQSFETAFANYVGAKYAVAVSNGTAALHLCAIALGITDGQKVITTPITFAATANCIKYCGGEVVFSDINPETYLLDIEKVKQLLEQNPKGTFKGIIPVDFSGRAVDMEKFRKLADEYDLWVIEDACHAPGGFFVDSKGNEQKCGNGKFADLAIFSFHPVKHIACGEGGMITTNDKALYGRLLKLRTHGITKNKDEFINDVSWANGEENSNNTNIEYPGWYMEMNELGFNYRLTDYQAALGISQLERADEGLKRRREISLKYQKFFLNKKWIYSQSEAINGHAYHLYVIEIENRLGLYNYLKEKNIFTQVHYIPTHLMPYYKELGWKVGDMINSENYYKGCLSLPMYPTLTDADQDLVIQSIANFYND